MDTLGGVKVRNAITVVDVLICLVAGGLPARHLVAPPVNTYWSMVYWSMVLNELRAIILRQSVHPY